MQLLCKQKTMCRWPNETGRIEGGPNVMGRYSALNKALHSLCAPATLYLLLWRYPLILHSICTDVAGKRASWNGSQGQPDAMRDTVLSLSLGHLNGCNPGREGLTIYRFTKGATNPWTH
jgi:hypothetical protein